MRLERLDKIAEIIAGQSPPSETYNKEGIGLPFFQGKADYGEMYPKVRYWCSIPTKLSYPHDILISVRAPVGPVNINNVKACIGRGLSAIRPMSENQTLYIYYYLKAIESDIARLGVGSTFTAITQKDLSGIKIPIPEDVNDQKRISTILSKAEKLIAQRKETIKLLDEFLKSVFLDMFGDPVRNEKGWEKYNGEQYSLKISVGVVIKPASYYVDKGVIALRSLNIKPNKILLNDIVYFSEEAHLNVLSKSRLKEGDVVIVRTGATGTAAVVTKELNDVNCIDLIIVRPDITIVNPLYLSWFFNSDRGKQIVFSKEVGGIQKHFNIGEIKKLAIPIPYIGLQNKFASIVEKAEILKQQYNSSLQELKNLYGSLSQRAFKGELDLSKVPIEEEPNNFSGPAPEEDKRYGNPFEDMELPKEGLIGRDEIEKLLGRGQEEIQESVKGSLAPIEKVEKSDQKYDVLPEKTYSYVPNNDWDIYNDLELANIVKTKFSGLEFNAEMLIDYLTNHQRLSINYFNSEELKNEKLTKSKRDFKSWLFDCISNKNAELKLEQFYHDEYRSEKQLLLPSDYEEKRSQQKQNDGSEFSGIYFRIVP